MTRTIMICAVKGELFNGRAMCGHHVVDGNRCGINEAACEHCTKETDEKGQNNEG